MSVPPLDVKGMVEAFAKFDRGHKKGRGESESPDSGTLGWGESRFLDAYAKLYEVTGETRWLDRIADHFDRIIRNAKDSDGDGYLDWATPTYSTGVVRTSVLHNRGTGQIEPAHHRERDGKKANAMRDAEYIVEFLTGKDYVLRENQEWQVLHRGAYRPGRAIDVLPGVTFTISGRPAVGDKFRIETRGARMLEYIVHQGMFTYPVARFVEAVSGSRALKARYGARVQKHLAFIRRHIVEKHERYWLDTSQTTGGYRFQEDQTERYPNRIMPHNQYLALARTFLVLQDCTKDPIYPDRAARMARNFRRALRKTGRAYTWYYWDWMENGTPGHSQIEDTSHGNIDIGFAVEACRRGVAFQGADLRRFGRTLLDQMWNGSLTDPKLGSHVDRKEGESAAIQSWIDLCQWEPQVWDICYGIFRKQGAPVQTIPTILQAWKRMP